MENQQYEKEIDLKSLLYYMLIRWKIMLVIVLLVSMLFGAYKCVSVFYLDTKTPMQHVEDVMHGIENKNVLSGDVLLYFDLVSQKKNISGDITNCENAIERGKRDLEIKKAQLDLYEQEQANVNSEDIALFISYKNSAESAIIACENDISDQEIRRSSLQETLNTINQNITILQDRILEEENKNNKSDVVKYILFGFAAGIVMFVGICCITYTFSGKLRDISILNAYGLQVLSVIPAKGKKGIKAQIEKLNGHTNKTREQAYDTVYARLLNLIGEDKNRVLITGTISGEVIKMITYLNKKDSTIKYIFCPNPIENPDSILMFKSADIILLVECKNKSMLSDISQELSYIKDVNKTPLGIVVVN